MRDDIIIIFETANVQSNSSFKMCFNLEEVNKNKEEKCEAFSLSKKKIRRTKKIKKEIISKLSIAK